MMISQEKSGGLFLRPKGVRVYLGIGEAHHAFGKHLATRGRRLIAMHASLGEAARKTFARLSAIGTDVHHDIWGDAASGEDVRRVVDPIESVDWTVFVLFAHLGTKWAKELIEDLDEGHTNG